MQTTNPRFSIKLIYTYCCYVVIGTLLLVGCQPNGPKTVDKAQKKDSQHVKAPVTLAAKAKPIPPPIGNSEQKTTSTIASIEHYLVFLPKDYYTSNKSYPTIFYLEGSGAKGIDINKVREKGVPYWADNHPDFPFIVIAPQCSYKVSTWIIPDLQKLFEEAKTKYRIDKHRTYLTGLSYGGAAAWSWAAHKPTQFAALAPIAAFGNVKEAPLLKKVRIWAFHNKYDPAISLAAAQQMLDAVNKYKIGHKATLTVYNKKGHDAWTKAYQQPDIYNWFLQYKNN